MKTLVMGASPNSERYSYKAVELLEKHQHAVVAIGSRDGNIGDIKIITGQPLIPEVHTVTMYIGKDKQEPLMDYIISLKPKRIIFNPGSENDILKTKATKAGIECIEACTLVLLHTNQF